MTLIKINSNKPFEIKNQTNKEADIVLYGSIGESFWDDSISAKEFHQALKELPSTVETLNVRINSPGGDVFDGITIYNRLKQHKAKKVVYIDGMAASIASIIAMAGDEVIIGEGAQVMIHKPWTMAMGNSLELDSIINRLDDIEEQMLSIYSKRTGLDRSELRSMLAKETWLLSEEAIDLGFADKTMDEDFAIAASWNVEDARWFKSKPKSMQQTKYVKNKLEELRKNIEGFIAR